MVERGRDGGLGSLLVWMAYPLAPALLASSYARALSPGGSDPRLWSSWDWPLELGPLVGYGFLAGATAGVPDPMPPSARRPWRWLRHRALWVAVGPWAGFLAWLGAEAAGHGVAWAADRLKIPWPAWPGPADPDGWGPYLLMLGVLALMSHGWLPLAWLALRRARRTGRFRRALGRGLATALAFVGSLVGGFWAATEAWRDYFFDPRPAPAVLAMAAALALLPMAGCSTRTLGDVRRNQLFDAMTAAWVLGLALAWRWASRTRGKPG